MKLASFLSTAAALTLATLSAQAAVLIGNYPQANDNTGTLFPANAPGAKAAGFTLPVGDDYTLDSAMLRLEVVDVNAVLTLSLFGDAGGNPVGPALATFAAPALSLGVGDYLFTPTTPVTLEDGATYWISLAIQTATDGMVWLSSEPGIVPTGIATSVGYRIGTNNPPQQTSLNRNTYQINATAVTSAVPEPGTALFGLALVGTALVRRRR